MKLELPRGSEFDAGVWYATAASTWYPEHFHDELEVKLVLWGHARYRMGTTEIELGPGSLFWLLPGQMHSLDAVSDDFAMWVGSFRCRAARAAEEVVGLRVLDQASRWGVRALPPASVQELSTAFAWIAHCEVAALVNAASHRLLTAVLAHLREHDGVAACTGRIGDDPRPLHDGVRQAAELLSDCEPSLPLGALALRCGLDESRLSRLFKRQMGLSTVEFRNHFRVQQFITRFGDGSERRMLQVALDSGFGSYPQFHRAFRRVTGYAPSEHLQRVRAGLVFPKHQGLLAFRKQQGPAVASPAPPLSVP